MASNSKESHDKGLFTLHRYSGEENAPAAFEAMVRDNKKCDGLVISGHHTGRFHGVTNNILNLEFMEKLSCNKNEKYQKWFKNIKSLWLFGCNTATDKYLAPLRRADTKGVERGKSGDQETTRVLDSSEYSLINAKRLNLSYSDVLDEYTPLSSRYMRIFPNTHLYGYDYAAPGGDQAGSHPVLSHVAQLGRALASEGDGTSEEENISRGIDVLSNEDCDEKSIKAWEGRGKVGIPNNEAYTKIRELGCELVNAQKTLIADQEILIKNQKILENSKALKEERTAAKDRINAAKERIDRNVNTITTTLDKIQAHEKIEMHELDDENPDDSIAASHLLFNSIFSTFKTAQNLKHLGNPSLLNAITPLLKGPSTTKALKDKINSPVGSSVKKVDYIKFYEHLHGKDSFVTESVKDLVEKSLVCAYEKTQCVYDPKKPEETRFVNTSSTKTNRKEIKSENRYLLTAVVTEQLNQYNLLTEKQIHQLMESPTFTNNTGQPFSSVNSRLQYTLWKVSKNQANKDAAKDKVLEIFASEMKDFKDKETLPSIITRLIQLNDIEFLNELASKPEVLASKTKVVNKRDYFLYEVMREAALDFQNSDFLKKIQNSNSFSSTEKNHAKKLLHRLLVGK